jgi:DNA-binding GntR family transcriptional regulator
VSPGGTMMRVYWSIKRRIMHGDFAPGVRLDPARLRGELAASTTPVRDALHRLTGEGFVESFQNEGFRVSQSSEPAIRDQYEWTQELVHLCLRSAGRYPADGLHGPLDGSYADQVTIVLSDIARLSANYEHRRALLNVSERSFLLRAIEEKLLDDPFSELVHIGESILTRNWLLVSTSFDRFHRTRLSLVPAIALQMREMITVQRDNTF